MKQVDTEQLDGASLRAKQLDTGQLDSTDSLAQQLASSQNTDHQSTEDAVNVSPLVEKPQQQGERPSLSRRSLIAGLGGGLAIALGVGGSLWWSRAATPAKQPVPPPGMVSLYTYQAPPHIYINDISWSSQGTMLACAQGDKTVQVHKAVTDCTSSVRQVLFSNL
ncbi:MAG: hypothetical protein H0V70_04060 [Ktedonobacteraceae bacterium]|nr:hypothetical protein [Ktedonobacteraceae bacterium]